MIFFESKLHFLLRFLFCLRFLDVIFGDKDSEIQKTLTHQLALNFCNDSCRLGICLFEKARLVALSCIQLAMKFHSVDDPKCQPPDGWLIRSLTVFRRTSMGRKQLKEKLDLICDRCMLVSRKLLLTYS